MENVNVRKGQVFFTCLILYSSMYIARVNMSVASPDMISAGAADVSQIGILGSVFSIVYALGRLLTGSFADKRAPFAVMALGAGITGFGNILMGTVPPYAAMLMIWALVAFGQSLLWGCILRTLGSVYEGEELKNRTAVMAATVTAGTIIGYVLDSWLCRKAGFAAAFLVPGLICILTGSLDLIIIRKIKVPEVPQRAKLKVLSLIKGKDLIGKFIPAFLHGLVKDNVSFWLPVILAMKYLVSSEITGLMIIIVPAAGMAGRMLYPALLKALHDNEDLITFYCFLAGAACSVWLIAGASSGLLATVLLGIIYAAMSMINTTFLSIYPVKFIRKGCSAQISGVMDFLSYGGAAAGSAFYGILAERFGYVSLYICWAVFCAAGIALLVISDRLSLT